MMKEIGNSIGVFVGGHDNSNKLVVKYVSCILVVMNLGRELPKSVEMVAGSWRYTQISNYVRVPFSRSFCHRYGHFKYECPGGNPMPIKEIKMGMINPRGLLF